jgi:uncharacterized delta-60 repeat protein
MGPTFFPLRRTRSGQAARRPAPRFRPRVEGLEDRLTPSGGQLDPTFGSGGIVNLPNATDVSARAVTVQPDGKVVIAGVIATRYHGNLVDFISVQRLNRDGSLDTTFNKTGSVTIQAGSGTSSSAVALQPDGKILVGGRWSSSKGSGGSLVARLNTNGTLDTTFASQGLWESSAAGTAQKLAVLTNATHTSVTGIVVAAPGTANGATCFEAIKLTPAGVPDKTFGSGGFAVFASLSGGGLDSVAVAPSGEVYLVGSVQFAGMTYRDGCIAAVTPSGALDTTFGGGSGYVLADPTGTQYTEFQDAAVQTLTVNGQSVSRLIASGYIDTPQPDGSRDPGFEAYVAAYTLGGALDTSFGSGGRFIDSNPNLADSSQLTLEADGSIVVEWIQSVVTPAQLVIGHLTANGTADTSFGSDGTGIVAISDGISWWTGVAIDPTDGSILACGVTRATNNSLQQAAVVRLTAP